MYRLLPAFVVATALSAAPAHAADIALGSSAGVGVDTVAFGGGATLDLNTFGLGFRSLPTLDIHVDDTMIQFYPLDLLVGLADENVVIAGSVFFGAVESPVTEQVNGVLKPGGTLGIADFEGLLILVAPSARIGVETGQDAHLGVYVVPSVGLAIADGELGLFAGGRVEMSVWF